MTPSVRSQVSPGSTVGAPVARWAGGLDPARQIGAGRRSRAAGERAALRSEGDRAADECVRRGRPVALPAMTAADRRIVHDHLLARCEIGVHAEGEDPQRHLVLVPLGARI